jgi:hypothetical protein
MDRPIYSRALAKVRVLRPYAAIISGRDVWANREGWRYTYESILQPVTHAYVIPHPDGTVGMGLFRELIFLQSREPAPVTIAMIDSRLRVNDVADLGVLGDQTPQRFARLLTAEDIEREASEEISRKRSRGVASHGEG